METRITDSNHLESVERLVSYSLRRPEPGSPALELFDPLADKPVTAAYFLLNPDPEASAEKFILQTLRRLLQQLSRSTERQQNAYHGRVRGRILWPATYKSRLVQGLDPTMYVCREVQNRYDTPENQLLKYMLEAFNNCLRILPQMVRNGMCYLAAGRDGYSLPNSPRLNRMESAVHSAWRNIRLMEVNLPDVISEYHLLQAETAQLVDYSELAGLYRHYQTVVLRPSWSALVKTKENFILLPERISGGGDDWIQLGARLLQARIMERR